MIEKNKIKQSAAQVYEDPFATCAHPPAAAAPPILPSAAVTEAEAETARQRDSETEREGEKERVATCARRLSARGCSAEKTRDRLADPLEQLTDIREYDVPYISRVSIDEGIK